MKTSGWMRPRMGLIAARIAVHFALLLAAPVVQAAPAQEQPGRQRPEWEGVAYGGIWTETSFYETAIRQKTEYRPSYIAVAGLNRALDTRLRIFDFETEGQLARHFGLMEHYEINGALVARWQASDIWPLSFAVGEGLSYATANPELENKEFGFESMRFMAKEERSRHMLNFMIFEIDVAVPKLSDTRLLMRIHHRSGIMGTYCLPTCGSNMVSYGLKFPLAQGRK